MRDEATSKRSPLVWVSALVAVVGWTLAIGLFVILWIDSDDLEMGSLAEWFTVALGAAGLGAVGLAAAQLRAQKQDAHSREERERRAQASGVYWTIEPIMTARASGTIEVGRHYYVVNGSNEPITNVGLVLIPADALAPPFERRWDRPIAPGERVHAFTLYYTDLPPGFRGVRASVPVFSAETTSTTKWDEGLSFADSAGTYWMRMPNIEVVEVGRTDTNVDIANKVRRWRQGRKVVDPFDGTSVVQPASRANAKPQTSLNRVLAVVPIGIAVLTILFGLVDYMTGALNIP